MFLIHFKVYERTSRVINISYDFNLKAKLKIVDIKCILVKAKAFRKYYFF